MPRSIQALVWHDMEGWLAGALATWNAGNAGAHLCVLRSGEIVLTCRLEDVAWHAGTDNNPYGRVYGRTPFWRSHNINPASVGIELEGFVATGYTPEQGQSVSKIVRWFEAKYHIPRQHIQDTIPGHHAHGEISSQRGDPGPKFNWDWVMAA